jgi:hypothetical protein
MMFAAGNRYNATIDPRTDAPQEVDEAVIIGRIKLGGDDEKVDIAPGVGCPSDLRAEYYREAHHNTVLLEHPQVVLDGCYNRRIKHAKTSWARWAYPLAPSRVGSGKGVSG